jgi:hypothetical protein
MLGSPLNMEEAVATFGSLWVLEIGPAPTALVLTVLRNYMKSLLRRNREEGNKLNIKY